MATMRIRSHLPRLPERLLVTGRILLANREEALVLVAPERAGLRTKVWKPPDELLHAGT